MRVYEMVKIDPTTKVTYGMHEMYYTRSKLIVGGNYRFESLSGIFTVLREAAEYDETGRTQYMEKSTRPNWSRRSPQTSIL